MIDALSAVLKCKTDSPHQKPTLCALADLCHDVDGDWVTPKFQTVW